jgi:hypothetical protein
MEHLVPSDKGIIQYRKKLRKLCRDLESGTAPAHVTDFLPNPVATYGGDTVLNIEEDAIDDGRRLIEIGEKVMHAQFDAETLTGSERVETVIDTFKSLEAGYRA